MLRFIPQDSEGRPRRRKLTQKACEPCRKRKKRCAHFRDVSDEQSGIDFSEHAVIVEHVPSNSSPVVPATIDEDIDVRSSRQTTNYYTSTTATPSDSINFNTSLSNGISENRRYASNTLSTSASSVEDADHHYAETFDREEYESRFVGDMNPEAMFLAASSPEQANPDPKGVWLDHRSSIGPQRSLILPLRTAASKSIYAPDCTLSSVLLPQLEAQCLRLLPVDRDYRIMERIYEEEVYPLFPIIDASTIESQFYSNTPTQVLLKQAVCLAATTSKNMVSQITLAVNGGVNTIDARRFARELSLAMQTSVNLELIKDKLALIQVLATLALFTQFSDDHHRSAELNARTMIHVQTAGIHHFHCKTSKENFRTRVFLCVWAIDRLVAAFQGRPVVLDERDIGKDMNASIEQQEQPSFRLLLRIVERLESIFQIYRPNKGNLPVDAHIPSFEEFVDTAGAIACNSRLLGTLEVLYHAVAMNSCPAPPFHEEQECHEYRSSLGYIRQARSAARVTAIVSDEMRDQLSYLPLVPYAISLSLRVAYRELRNSKIPLFRMRARKQLMSNSSLLKEMADVFPTCKAMADLAEKVVWEMDRTMGRIIAEQNQANKNSNVDAETVGSSGSAITVSTAEELQIQGMQPAANEGTLNPLDAAALNPDMDLLDLSMFDNMGDFDIFTQFGPDFDLDAIDTALGDV